MARDFLKIKILHASLNINMCAKNKQKEEVHIQAFHGRYPPRYIGYNMILDKNEPACRCPLR